MLCPQSAFIDEKEYVLPPLKSKSDKEFHEYVAKNYAPKYPELKLAYHELRLCWDYYHSNGEQK